MAEGKRGFKIYADWKNWLSILTQEQKAEWVDWLFDYVNDLHPEMPKDQALLMACNMTRNALKIDLENYYKKIDAGKKGGIASQLKQKQAKQSKAKQDEAQTSTLKQNEAKPSDMIRKDIDMICKDKICNDNTHINVREEESINVLQNLIQEIEKRFNRVLTIYETTTIQDLAKSFTATQILNEIEANMDKEKPINYIKSKLEHATIQRPIKEEEKKTTYPTEINCWLDAWKISVSDEAPQYLKEKAKAYMEGK